VEEQKIKTKGYGLVEAARAARALLRDPNDVTQVFNVVNALPGRAIERTAARMRRTPDGARLLAQRPSMVRVLCDRDALRALPAGTLGREYVRFMEEENITAEGLLAADNSTGHSDDELEFVWRWMRDTHDLWHVVTGYRGDLLGEGALQAFNYVQTLNPGIGFITAAVFVKGGSAFAGMRRMMLEAVVRGLRSTWLPAVDWRSLLPLPVEEVRRRLGVPPLRPYQPLRIADLPGGKLPS
jgi:ubiquinone biosynthesis protein COQ4